MKSIQFTIRPHMHFNTVGVIKSNSKLSFFVSICRWGQRSDNAWSHKLYFLLSFYGIFLLFILYLTCLFGMAAV